MHFVGTAFSLCKGATYMLTGYTLFKGGAMLQKAVKAADTVAGAADGSYVEQFFTAIGDKIGDAWKERVVTLLKGTRITSIALMILGAYLGLSGVYSFGVATQIVLKASYALAAWTFTVIRASTVGV